jgi:hypothetical protein
MESSLIMAAFPNYPTMAYVVGIVWVVPVLLGVFAGGTLLFAFMGGFGAVEPAFPSVWPPVVLISTCLLLLILPTWLAHMYAPWFMDQRRCGRWG